MHSEPKTNPQESALAVPEHPPTLPASDILSFSPSTAAHAEGRSVLETGIILAMISLTVFGTVPVLMTVHPAPTADFFFLFPSGDI